jgi:predicted GIY-YIG superfamily endonuclease
MVIYKVTNRVNGKLYIGQTIGSLEKRKSAHISSALTIRNNIYFYNAIRKY